MPNYDKILNKSRSQNLCGVYVAKVRLSMVKGTQGKFWDLLLLLLFCYRFGEQFGFDCKVWDERIRGGIRHYKPKQL